MVLSMFLNSIIQDGESCDLALIPTIEFWEQYCGSLHAAQWHQHAGWQLHSDDLVCIKQPFVADVSRIQISA
jgi:hypothetical protein